MSLINQTTPSAYAIVNKISDPKSNPKGIAVNFLLFSFMSAQLLSLANQITLLSHGKEIIILSLLGLFLGLTFRVFVGLF